MCIDNKVLPEKALSLSMEANKHGSGQDWHAAEIHPCRRELELTGIHPPVPAEGSSLEQLSMCCLSPDHLSFPNLKNGKKDSSSVKLGIANNLIPG